jgi:hypothetical protein
MPRLSTNELNAARARKAQERAAEGARQAEEEEREFQESQARAESYRERFERVRTMKSRQEHLLSVVSTIYEEVDKLSRQWPDMPVSKLQLDKTNKAVRAVRELLKDEGDDFLDDINELVAAGDPIESRDVVLTLGELKSALARLPKQYQGEWHRLERERRESIY